MWQLFDFRIKKLYSFSDIQFIYGISRNDFLKYKSLTLSIPKQIIDELRNNEFNPNVKSQINVILTKCQQTKQTNKLLYRTLNKFEEVDTCIRIKDKRAQRALGRSPEEKVNGHSGSNNREPQGHNLNNFGRGPFDDVIY